MTGLLFLLHLPVNENELKWTEFVSFVSNPDYDFFKSISIQLKFPNFFESILIHMKG